MTATEAREWLRKRMRVQSLMAKAENELGIHAHDAMGDDELAVIFV